MIRGVLISALLAFSAGCIPQANTKPREAVFVGIDVSGSFRHAGHYKDSMRFLSHYIYGRLNKLGDLRPMKELYVGTIGGEEVEEIKAFVPIHDFKNKDVKKIEALLLKLSAKANPITDFNIFFKQVAHISRKRNLSLTPITVVLLSDGIPAVPDGRGGAKLGKFEDINIKELEFLSRKVTVRVLYTTTASGREWESAVPRRRVRMWTVDQTVMRGWREQLIAKAPPEEQVKLWKWVNDTVDFRVRPFRGR